MKDMPMLHDEMMKQFGGERPVDTFSDRNSSTDSTGGRGLGSGRNWLILGLRLLVAVAFTAAALAKLAGVEELIAVYDRIGIGQWFRYVTVAVEFIGVIGVLAPRCTASGALLLAATMFVAALTCVFILERSPVPALILCSLCALLAYLTRGQLIRRLSGLTGRHPCAAD